VLPDLDDLRCFVAAARLLHFRNAAKSVALTPAAFGQRIRRLEDQVGRPLFRRTTRTVHLTEAGRTLVPSAEACLEQAEACLRTGRGEIAPPPLEITLGTRHELGLSWIVPQLEGLSRSLPWLFMQLYVGSGSDLLLRVRTMEIDCAVTSTRLIDPKLDSFRLHREDYVFCGSRSLLARAPFTRAEHASAHTLFDTTAELPLFKYWRDAGGGGDRLRFGRVVKLGGIELMRHRVAEGAGVAVLPRYIVEDDLRRGRFRTILPSVEPLHDYFRLVFRADDPRRSAFESLANELMKTPLS
jgi:DNA-binding transcriptional LysR family regulator